MKSSTRVYIFSFTLFMFTISFMSCSDNDCCTIIDRGIQIHYITPEGEDLLNSSEDFNESNIRIYYKNGTNYDYPYNINLDDPNMHDVYIDNEGNQILNVFLSDIYEGNQSTTLIELNNTISDTIRAEFKLDNNSESISKIWFNGIELTDRFFEVIK